MKTFFAGLLLIILPNLCFAMGETGTFQCSNGIVSVGDSREAVLEKCGQPESKEELSRVPLTHRKYQSPVKMTTEYWRYNPGPNGFVHVLEMRGGGGVVKIVNTEKHGW